MEIKSIGEMDIYTKAQKVQEIKAEIEKLEETKGKLEEDREFIESEITKEMKNNHDVKSCPFKDLNVVRYFYKKYKITDVKKVISQIPEWQREMCIKYDEKFIKDVIKLTHRNEKKLIEGAEFEEAEYLKITEKEEK